MSDAFERVVAEQAEHARRAMGSFRSERYDWLVEVGARPLWKALSARDVGSDGAAARSAGDDGAEARSDALCAYLRLGAQGLAEGTLAPDIGSRGLLGRLWLDVVPRAVPPAAVGGLGAHLVELWNVADGIHGEALWLDRAVSAALPAHTTLEGVEAALAAALRDVLAPGQDPSWQQLSMETLDLRACWDSFVPGSMHLLSPRVLCVHGRSQSGGCIGVSLDAERSAVLGPIDCAEAYRDPRPTPELEMTGGALLVDGRYAPVVDLGTPHELLAVPAGFIVLSALDSQRLWVVAGRAAAGDG